LVPFLVEQAGSPPRVNYSMAFPSFTSQVLVRKATPSVAICPLSRVVRLSFLAFCLFSSPSLSLPAQQLQPSSAADPPNPLFNQVIANQKQSETELDQYERVQRTEVRRTGSDTKPAELKTWRVFPTGTGTAKFELSPDGKPPNLAAYRAQLEKVESYLTWVMQDGTPQKEAYARTERKRKERFELIEATHEAFLFTLDGKETRGGRTLLRYLMRPNPNYRPTTRNTALFTHVQGTLWVDEKTSELAKVDGVVTEDISLALFLAKVYKGSHFMQERYEIAPGIWEPTFEQYDFDGRKFLRPFSIHERTFYSDYKHVGPPSEAIQVVRGELSKLGTEGSHP
jgi:hypothetical protein